MPCWRLAGVVLLPDGGDWKLMLSKCCCLVVEAGSWFSQCPNVQSVKIQCPNVYSVNVQWYFSVKMFTCQISTYFEFWCNFVQFVCWLLLNLLISGAADSQVEFEADADFLVALVARIWLETVALMSHTISSWNQCLFVANNLVMHFIKYQSQIVEEKVKIHWIWDAHSR